MHTFFLATERKLSNSEKTDYVKKGKSKNLLFCVQERYTMVCYRKIREVGLHLLKNFCGPLVMLEVFHKLGKMFLT